MKKRIRIRWQKTNGKINTCFPEVLNSEEEKTKNSENPGQNLTENPCRAGRLQPTLAKPSCPLLSRDPLQFSMTFVNKVHEDQIRETESESELERRNKEPKSKKRSRMSEHLDSDVNISKNPVFSNIQNKNISENESDKITGGMSKHIQQNYSQFEDQENQEAFNINHQPPNTFESYGTLIPDTIPISNASSLERIFENLGPTDKFDALMRGEFVLDIIESDFLPDSPDLNRPTNKNKEQKEENTKASGDQKGMKVQKFLGHQFKILKEPFYKNEYNSPNKVKAFSKTLNLTPQQATDEIPTTSMNNSSLQKGILLDLSNDKKRDVILKSENPEKMDFLLQTPPLTRFKNEDAENIEPASRQENKIRYKFSEYQLQILSEYFQRNEYIRPNEVKFLSNTLAVSPQRIKFWFGNQRAKKKKMGTSNST
ncbi:uncharacterized protein LOC116419942 [Sarcophilus harrisii]|uniref:uncharacterized protein LOC116419941 n=1 Tax=Sarcophilus harrisii TaxID=9305 RepID=UPI001301EB06|nr:uncharacterized protein LOC116419941 [Sarcophilus harrisii]XP_031798539.1 uncharacterized protein LOC116419942 [Sarcophilus harrisii]